MAANESADKQAATSDFGTGHPFGDPGRRVDLVLYPPVPGAILAYKRATLHTLDERGVEFTDIKGNYYRVANMPYIIASFDPNFDPDTEGRLIRGGGIA